MVLDVMFPELTQKEMETLDVTQFTQLVDGRQAALEERQMNLNITAMSRTTTTTTTTTTTVSTTSTTTVAEGSGGSDGSGDSDGSGSDGSGDSDGSGVSDGSGGSDGSGETDTDNTETESGGNRRKRFASHHRRARRQISFNEMYDGMLVPENEVKGIQPKGGDLKNAEVCPCGPPASKLRKEIKLKVAWENDMWDPNSDNFQRIKAEVEEKVRMYHTF